ncbi:MAG: class II fructose-bisphosphate aldolase [Candidatus Brocadiales bacterium]
MKPISGKKMYHALKDKDCIILACNPRVIPGVAKGIFRAAKETDSPVIMELARTECNQHGGYTGLTPELFSNKLLEVNEEVGHDIWALHADHIGIKEGTPEDIEETKELIQQQINAGYTSFAIDASHLFNFEGDNVEEELEPNLKATIEIGLFLKEKMGDKEFGLEVEVGEIGRENEGGHILTKPEEAVTFISRLKEAGLDPDVLAIANGSSHGNVFDKDGNPIEQVSIDIERTKEVARALKEAGHDVKIAQHGITGTPLEIVRDKFPKGDIIKGNVATLFQNIVYECLESHEPELYKEVYDWVMEHKPIEGKKPEEVFGKNAKHGIKVFFERIYNMNDACLKEVEERSYREAMNFMEAFNSVGKASIVRKTME